MQSEEERGGGSDHAYDKTGKKKNQERMRRGSRGGWRREKYLNATAVIQFVMHILDVKTRDT